MRKISFCEIWKLFSHALNYSGTRYLSTEKITQFPNVFRLTLLHSTSLTSSHYELVCRIIPEYVFLYDFVRQTTVSPS